MPVSHTLKNLWPLFLGLFLIMVGNGLQGTLLGVRASIEEFSTLTIGLIMSLYYGGFLAGSILAPRLVKNVGHIRVFAAMASLASAVTLLHGLFVDPWIWVFARVISGFSFAALYIVIESWLNDASTNNIRGKILGSYLLTFYIGMLVGQYMLYLAPADAIDLFVMISILISCALLPVSLSRRPAPDFSAPEPIKIREVFQASPLGTTGVVLGGLGVGLLFSIGPVYALQIGMDITQIPHFMAFLIIGGVFGPVPVGLLSDRFSRRTIIIGLSAGAFLSSLFCLLVSGDIYLLYFGLFCLGVTSLSIYGVCAAYAQDHMPREKMVGTNALLILLNGSASFISPFLTSLFMVLLGPPAFLGFCAATFLALFLFALYRTSQSPGITLDEQSDMLAMPQRSTTIVAQIAEEE